MNRNISRGIALKLGQTFFFTLMYTSIKLTGHIPVGEVIFFRAFFALIPLALWTWLTSDLRVMIRMRRPGIHALRAVIGSCSMLCNFSAVQLLPLVTVTAFGFLSPVLMVVFAIPLLGEKVGIWRWSAVLMGFCGVLLMIEPHGGLAALGQMQLTRGVWFALAFVAFNALIVIIMRKMTRTERSEAMVFYFMSWCAIVGAVSMLFYFTPPTGKELFWLITTGFLGGFGQICFAYCYRYASPSVLAPFDYTTMPWAMLLGWFVFGEMPELVVLAGAVVVISAGLIIIWRERVHRQERPEQNLHAS